MILTADVQERTIAVDNLNVVQNNVSIDRFVLNLDSEWKDVESVKVVFYCKSAVIEKQYEEGGIDIPWEITQYTDGFMITVIGYFANGDRLVTRKMKQFISVDESGLIEGEEAGEATEDAYQSLLNAYLKAIEETESTTDAAIMAANNAASNANLAANTANQVIAQLPLPSGNILKGNVEGSTIHVEDAYTAPLLGFVIFGAYKQDGTPTHSMPVEIQTVTSAKMCVSGADAGIFTATPELLSGNELAALPDGTRDELRVDDLGNVTLVKRVGKVDSYGGELVPDGYVSTTGSLTEGATVYYALDTTQENALCTIDMLDVPESVLNACAETDLATGCSVTYQRDINIAIGNI